MKIESIGIIGYGDFGGLIETVVENSFPTVDIRISSSRFEPDGERFFSLADTCKADLVFPTVPLHAFAGMVEKMAPLVGSDSIVFEVGTVKTHPQEVLDEYDDLRFIATHPMFGPYSFKKHGNSLENLRIVITDHTLSDSRYKQITELLTGMGLAVVEMSADEHDRQLARSLFLTHLIGQTIRKADFARTDIDTVSFGYLMDAVESVENDSRLFRDVFRLNPYCKEVLEEFEGALESVRETLE